MMRATEDSVGSVFVSFSGRDPDDRACAREFSLRLKDIGLDPWIYERLGTAVPAAQPIDAHCYKMIRQCDWFVAIVSDSSLRSEYTRSEVKYALSVVGPEGIFQVVTTGTPRNEWPTPYRELTSFKGESLRCGDPQHLEQVIQTFCAWCKVPYVSPVAVAAKLPLLKRTLSELGSAVAQNVDFTASAFDHLRRIAMEADRAYAANDKRSAHNYIDLLLTDLASQFPHVRPYYPRIVKAVLLLELSVESPRKAIRARDLLKEMLDNPEGMPVDENLPAALAAVEYRLQNAEESLRLYRVAHDIVRHDGRIDGDIVHNIVMAANAAQSELTQEEESLLIGHVQISGNTQDALLRERLEALKIYRYIVQHGRECPLGPAASMVLSSAAVVDILLRLCQSAGRTAIQTGSLTDCQATERMYQSLVASSNREFQQAAIRCFARFKYETSDFEGALALLRQVDQREGPDLEFMFELFWCHIQRRSWKVARELLTEVAESSVATVPFTIVEQRANFHYFRGFAHWWLGNEREALQDFRDSGRGRSDDYREVAQRHLGAKFTGARASLVGLN